jgi:hypothetical protein
MPRPPRPQTDDDSDARFRQALADARRREEASDEAGATRRSPNPLAGATFPIDPGSRRATGGASHWRAALDFIDEQSESAPRREPPRVAADTPEAILKELGLTETLTETELGRLRRLFMWRNHPDRYGESQRAGATRRAAIANMLIDRARARLAVARRP